MPSKIESSLTPEQFWDFCEAVAKLRGGRKGATLKDIQRIAGEWGIGYISENSAKSFRDTAFADYLGELKAKADRAQQVAAYAREGLSMSEAASVRLSESVFDELMSRDPSSFTAEERDIYSKIIARARAGDDRATKLTADLRVREEQVAKLERERTKWEEQRAQIVAATAKVRAATPATADEVRAAAVAAIDEIMGIKSKPKK